MQPVNWGPTDFLGHVITSPNAKARVSRKDIATALLRHVRSVHGESDGPGRPGKLLPLDGCRMLTAYRASNGTPFWILSESDQSITRVMLPEDYGAC
jgi:hypothetical protein